MLYIFTGIDQLPEDFIRTCSYFLPKWRLDQVMSYRFPSDRKRCAMAYLLLVNALKNEGFFYALPEFGYDGYGKPFLSNYPDIYFNVSHCHDVVACFLSDKEVGVDVERVCKYDDDLARAICSDNEYRWISGFSDPDIRAKKFTELWTRKESLVKCHGIGLNCDLKNIFTGDCPDMTCRDFHISSFYDQTGDFYISTCRTNNQNIIK